MNPVRVLIVNEVPLISNVIAAIMEEERDIEVIGSVTAGGEALEKADQCDVILVSTRLADGEALRLTQALTDTHPQVKVLVMGLAESETEILQYVEAGAAGYVLKDDSVDELIKHIRAANRDEAIISPEIAAALISRVNTLAQTFADIASVPGSVDLTPREQDVLKLIGHDLSNREIADQLVIEVGTVKNHVHSILSKLNVSSRQDAASYWAVIRENSG